MLKTCVLIGLHWAEPMMFFFFTRHMLMHCSCIHTFSFSYLVLFVDGVFLFVSLSSLSLFLSLSLSHIVRAWHPSTKPLHLRIHFVSVHSFDSTPLHVRVRYKKARQDFSKNFSVRGVHSECHMILSDFSDTTLPTIIHSRGWESLCEIPMSCPSVIIQEFYSNMHDFDYSIPCFITSIQGTRIVVTSELISDVLHVLRVSHLNYPGCPCMRTVSKDELLSLFCETPSL